MSIQEIIQSGANISITVGANDLLQFATHLVASTKKELESSLSEVKEEKRFTPSETAKKVRVDRSTLHRWAKSGYLVPIEVGGKRFYKQSDIDAILNQ